MIHFDIKPANQKMIEYACKNYHYAKCVPASRKMGFAIFEEKVFVGVIVFSLGATKELGTMFGLKTGECIELTRVALGKHQNPVTTYISRCIKIIKRESPNVQMIVSFADKDGQGHYGKIYQGGNWIFIGTSHISGYEYFYNGKWTHQRTITGFAKEKRDYLIANLPKRKCTDKYKYIYPMNNELFEKYKHLGKPYPNIENEGIIGNIERKVI